MDSTPGDPPERGSSLRAVKIDTQLTGQLGSIGAEARRLRELGFALKGHRLVKQNGDTTGT